MLKRNYSSTVDFGISPMNQHYCFRFLLDCVRRFGASSKHPNTCRTTHEEKREERKNDTWCLSGGFLHGFQVSDTACILLWKFILVGRISSFRHMLWPPLECSQQPQLHWVTQLSKNKPSLTYFFCQGWVHVLI